jgi:hypothetical protein
MKLLTMQFSSASYHFIPLIASNDRMINDDNNELERMWKETVVAQSEVQRMHLPGGAMLRNARKTLG